MLSPFTIKEGRRKEEAAAPCWVGCKKLPFRSRGNIIIINAVLWPTSDPGRGKKKKQLLCVKRCRLRRRCPMPTAACHNSFRGKTCVFQPPPSPLASAGDWTFVFSSEEWQKFAASSSFSSLPGSFLVGNNFWPGTLLSLPASLFMLPRRGGGLALFSPSLEPFHMNFHRRRQIAFLFFSCFSPLFQSFSGSLLLKPQLAAFFSICPGAVRSSPRLRRSRVRTTPAGASRKGKQAESLAMRIMT